MLVSINVILFRLKIFGVMNLKTKIKKATNKELAKENTTFKTKAKREAILNYVELNPGCCAKEMTNFFRSAPQTINCHLRELKKENQIEVDDSTKSHTYRRVCDADETIVRFIVAEKFFLTQESDTNLKEYLNVMKDITSSRPSLCYYVMLHYKAFVDDQAKLTDENLIGMPYSQEKSSQDLIIEKYRESQSLFSEIKKTSYS